MKLVSKWNWKNFYGFDGDQILEIVKLGVWYYRTKYKHGKLIPVGEALKKKDFIFFNQ